MSIAGLILLLILIAKFFIKREDYRFFIFKITIIVNIFINLGYFSNKILNLTYGSFLMYFFVGISIINLILKQEKLNKDKIKIILSIFALIFVLILGLYNLKIGRVRAFIAPWSRVIDDIAYNKFSLQLASFGAYNIKAMRELIVFCLFCYFSYDYLFNKIKIKSLINSFQIYFSIFLIFLILEFIVSNSISPFIYRGILNNIFGIADKTYIIPPMRYGVYSAYGFFTEPSYVGGVLLIFYSIKYIIGFKNLKDKLIYLISFISIFICGSSTAVTVSLLGILVAIKWILNGIKINKKKLGTTMIIVPIFILLMLYFINTSSGLKTKVAEESSKKIEAYINNSRSNGSAYSRKFGNDTCYNVLKSDPILGVGLGTTRGFGLIPGIVANIGILGVITYIIFIFNVLNLKITKNNIILFLIILGYLTSMFSIWHIYMPTIIMIMLPFNKDLSKIY